MPSLYNKKGVEIFSVGNWNGDDYTIADLQEMVRAFEETKSGAQPHLKLGHDPKQKLLQEDGLPAAGWVDRLYIKGEKLMADFVDIPKKIWELMENRAYKKVSSEIFWNINIGEKTYKRMLAAVALLGADTPGVMNLSDILSMYSKQATDLKIYKALELNDSGSKQKGGFMPEQTEKEIKLQYDLEKSESELKAATEKLNAVEAEQKAKDQELEDLKKFKAQAVAEQAKLVAEAKAAQIKAFVATLKSDKLCTPAMEQLVTELLGDDKKEYSVKISEKETKLSKEELLKETLKLFAAAKDVNFDENSSAGKEDKKDDKHSEMDKKAKEYMDKNKCSYSVALKAVMRDQK